MVSLCSRWAEGYSGRQGAWGLTCFCCSTLFQVSQDLDLDMMQLKLFVPRLSAALSSGLQGPTIFYICIMFLVHNTIKQHCHLICQVLHGESCLECCHRNKLAVWWKTTPRANQNVAKSSTPSSHIMCLKSRHTCYNLYFLRFLYLLHPKIYLGWKAKDDAATLIPSNPFHTPGFLTYFSLGPKFHASIC